MTEKPTQPLRGEAAWRAEKQEIAKRNDAARAVGARQRAEKDAASSDEAAKLAQREMRFLREHPPGPAEHRASVAAPRASPDAGQPPPARGAPRGGGVGSAGADRPARGGLAARGVRGRDAGRRPCGPAASGAR